MPDETADPTDELEELGPRVAAAASRLSRADPAAELRAQPAGDLMHELTPQLMASPPASDATMAPTAVRVAEATPRFAAAAPSSAGAQISSLPLVDLALPRLDEGALEGQAEPTPKATALRTDATRPPVSVIGEISSSSDASRLAVLTPERTKAGLPVDSTPANLHPSPRESDPALPPAGAVAYQPPADDEHSLALPLRVPAHTAIPTSRFGQREPEHRRRMLERMGGSEETERAVKLALKWLADHQNHDGHWDGLRFDDGCGGCGGQTEYEVDVALTGLSLLCFLGAGHTHVEDGPYQDNVGRAMVWLLNRQQPNGDLRDGETMYSHGIAAIALAEAYGMARDSALYERVTRSVKFVADARGKRTGGWRYNPGEAGDTSVLGWQVMALSSAQTAGIEVPAEAFQSARAWLRRAEPQPGLYAYRPKKPVTPTMTAEAMFVQQLLGARRNESHLQVSARFISRNFPDWEEGLNTYNWYYTTLALFHYRGPSWSRWNEALTAELLEHQNTTGSRAGSWDPDGKWAGVGGRVYQTALCTLMLEVYYRYLPMYSLDQPVVVEPVPPAGAIGAIGGLVSDAATGEPLTGAVLRLDLPDAEPLSATTDASGAYTLHVPRVPDHFALTASHQGYTPQAVNIAAEQVRENRLTRNF
ncbi:MAG: carboxypeptidase regulatory-like domain-containing protein, partial [Planctomycetota bacterium]